MTNANGLKNVEKIINDFGGMRPMSRKVEVAVSTIQGWKKRDHIPADRVDEILNAAKKHNVTLNGGANQNAVVAPSAPVTKPKIQNKPVGTPSKPVTTAIKTEEKQTAPVQSSAVAPSSVKPKTQTETAHNNAIHTADLAKIRNEAVRRSVLTTLAVIGVIGGAAWFLFGNEVKEVTTFVQNQKQAEATSEGLFNQFFSFEHTVTDGLNSLSSRITDVAASVGVERNASGEVILNNDLSVSERLTALESRLRASGEEIDLGQLMNKFDSLNKTAQGTGNTNAALSDLKGVITILQGRMGQMDAALTEAKQENAVLAESLENVNGRDLGAAAMLLALTQFRDSMNREEPFVDDLAILQELVGTEDPELTADINRLAPYAQNGVLTPEGLSKELRTITGEIVMAKLQGEDVSVQDKILGRLGQILSVEKDGKPLIATREQELIATAQKHLDAGDVQSAVATLNQLDGEAAKAAQPFTQKAMGTLAAQGTTDALMKKFMEKLQDPQGLQNMIQGLPAQIQDMTSGTVVQDDASGIIILQ